MGWSCASVRRRLPLYCGGDLTSAERQPLTLHLKTCRSCHRYHAELEEALAALREGEPSACVIPGGSLWPEVRAVVMAGQRQAAPYRYWRIGSGWAAAACMLVALTIWLQQRGTNPPAPVVRYFRSDIISDPWLSGSRVQPVAQFTEPERPWPVARRKDDWLILPLLPGGSSPYGFDGDLRYVGNKGY